MRAVPKVYSVTRALAGAVLAVSAGAGVIAGFSPAASAATAEATTVTLTTVKSPVGVGFEDQTFRGTVTGQPNDGYPTTGAVTVKTTATVTLCTGSLTPGSGDAANFTCVQSTPSKLPAGTYTVHANYAGGNSSNSSFTYNAGGPSATATLKVVTPTPETSTVRLNTITSPVQHGSEAQTFKGTVTGKTGDGWPATGVVTIETTNATGNVVLCRAALTGSGSGVTADFSCNAATPTKLPAGTYKVHASYAGGGSSKATYSYTASTSAQQTLTVVTGVLTTTTLVVSRTSVVLGSETAAVFTATVTGRSGDGYPKGKVTVTSTTGKTLCSTSVRSSGTSVSSKFTCTSGASTLSANTYKVTAAYTPTSTHSSSTNAITYLGSTSSRVNFTVSNGVTSSVLGLNYPDRRSGAETSEVFTVTVSGISGDGYPRGTVKVKTTGGTAVCTTSTITSHTASASTFACSPHASALSAGAYTVLATFTPGSPSSSTTKFTYAGSTSNTKAFSVISPGATRIFGATPDATAAQELESVYTGGRGVCPGSTSNRAVVLATDQHYPDALAASYLEKWLGTGLLLTPTASLSGVTQTALRVEGITHVYVVGGRLAVSTTVVSQIENTFAYRCGGTSQTSTHITVTRIAGNTQYTTAEDIADYPGSGFVGGLGLQGAYGHYNDTSGTSSKTPAAGTLRTAILASGAGFHDAESAATAAYADDLPLLLTTPTSLSPQALSALTSLRVTQVILLGGPAAVSNAVVTALASHGISVLRVAGIDYTDTAVQLADLELASATGHKGLGWSPTGGVTVAQGSFYSDGLAGAIVSATGGVTAAGPQPLLLTETPTSVGSYLTTFLRGAGTSGINGDGTPVISLTILGGSLAVSTQVVSQMESDL